MRSVSFSLLILLVACSDQKLSTYAQPPVVTIQTPTSGSTLDEGVPIALRGIAQDDTYDDSPELMTASWSANGSPICEGSVVAAGGFVDCTHTFDSPGDVTLALRITNPDGGTAQSSVDVTIAPNNGPSISILSPAASGTYYSDYPLTFSSEVSDNEDAPSDLSVAWTSGTDGILTVNGTPSADGVQSGETLLSEGTHDLTATVTDTTGLTSSATTRVVVNGPNNPPDCEILAPVMGDVFEDGETILFQAAATDADIDSTDLTVVWTSDKDGELSTASPTSSGEILLAVAGLTLTTHTITLTVTDEVGGNCTDSVLIKVGTGPDVVLLSPSSGDWYNEGTSIDFAATATDGEDDATDLSIAWSSDRDGVFSNQGADSSGLTAFNSDRLTIGAHVLAVTATDTDGLSTSATATININDLPSAPTIQIQPNPPASNEDLVAAVVFPSIDAEGHTMNYRYSWTQNGNHTSYVGTTVPASATKRGEVWAVTVTPNDGYGDGESDADSVTVGNAAPVLTSVALTPDPAYNDSTMTCTPGATSDNDGDSVTYSYAWAVNGSSISPTTSTLSTTWFSSGDTITCTVTPSDSTESGAAVSSNTVTVKNSAPVVSSASLTPTTAYETSTLTCSAGPTSDADGDSVTLAYSWKINGISSAVTTSTMTGTWFDKTDIVSCAITPNDGTDNGSTVTSSSVTIKNSVPTVTSASLSPTSATEASTLTCSAGSTYDADGDSVSVSYGWTVNGTTLSVTGASLTGTYFNKNNAVACTVTPNDGTDNGSTVTSSSVTIKNTPPTVSSVSISPTTAYTTDDLVATPSGWYDLDGDTAGYTYQWYINGSSVSGATGETLDYIEHVKDDEVTVIATAFDGDDAGTSATSSIRVIQNSKPTAPVVLVAPTDAEPEDNLTCSATTASTDADGDTISYVYAWQVNGVPSSITASTVSHTYTAHNDTWTCTMTPYDGDEYGSSGADSQVVADRTSPNAPVVNAIDEYRNATSVTISGTAEALSSLTLYKDCDSGLSTQTTTVSSAGTWSFSVSITQGDYCEYYAYATDSTGNVSTVSNVVGTESCDPFDDYEDSTSYGDSCSSAVNAWSALSDAGTSTISFVGNIVDSTDDDWYVIQASQSVTAVGTNKFNFEVEMIDGTSDYAFTIYQGSCSSSALLCDDGGTEGDGYSEFSFYAEDQSEGGSYHYTPSDTRYCDDASRYNDCDDFSGYYYIHVYRTTAGYDCTSYELEITNGVW